MNDPPPKPTSDQPAKPKPLSSGDAAEFAAQIAELAIARLPLGPGLRAAAAELPKSRLQAAFLRVAAAVDRGQSLDEALAGERTAMPRDVAALVAAGARSGRLGIVLEDFLRFRQQTDDLRRKVRRAMAYPLLLIAMLAGVTYFYFGYFFSQIGKLRDIIGAATSGTQLTHTSAWLERHGMQLLISAAAVLAVAILMALVARRPTRWLLNNAPLVGALWRLSGRAEWAELMRILLESQVPLPEALRLSAAAIRDADLAAAVGRAAARVESGARLSDAIAGVRQFGEAARSFLKWGEEHSALGQAFEGLASLSIRRLQLRADLIAAIGPPAVFMLVTAVVMFTVMLPGIAFGPLGNPSTIAMLSGSRRQADLELPIPSFLGAASLFFLGCVLLIAIRLVYAGRNRPDQPQIAMRLTAWLMLALGLLGMMLVVWGEVGVVLWLIGIVCWGGAVCRFRRSQRMLMLELLALAADRAMPLEPAVRCIADEEGGLYYTRATALADRLAAGTPLALAIQGDRKAVPSGAFPAARIGEVSGAVGPALRTVDPARNRPAGEPGVSPIRASSIYYIVLVFCGFGIFLGSRIAPAFRKIFADFKQELPALTKLVFEISASPITISFCVVSMLAAVALAFIVALRELGWIRAGLPIFDRATAPEDTAAALRLLAIVAEQGAPLEPALTFLGDAYPPPLVRGRLRRAARDVARGAAWVASLRIAKLVDRSDETILRAAARVGNLPWALREAANNIVRRAAYRRAATAQIVFPLLIMAVGAVVMIFIVAWYLPLVALIHALAEPRW